jgi:hypothetical protein
MMAGVNTVTRTYRDVLWNLRVWLVDGLLTACCAALAVAAVGHVLGRFPEGSAGNVLLVGTFVLVGLVTFALYARASLTVTEDVVVVRNPYRTVQLDRDLTAPPGRSQVWIGRFCVTVKASGKWPRRVRIVALPEEVVAFLTAR